MDIVMNYDNENQIKCSFKEFKSCDLPFALPNNLILWCKNSGCPVSECQNITCSSCTNRICYFRCKKHQKILMNRYTKLYSDNPCTTRINQNNIYKFHGEQCAHYGDVI